MTDDEELHRRIADAHRDDAPPPFSALRQPRRRRGRFSLALAPVGFAVATALALVLMRPPPSPVLPSLYVESRGPLDFLLKTPGGELLRETPHFDKEGAIP
jgi:hypothetical protein